MIDAFFQPALCELSREEPDKRMRLVRGDLIGLEDSQAVLDEADRMIRVLRLACEVGSPLY